MAEERDDQAPQDPPQESWFLQLQRESWYLEMITSGVALFFVFQVPGAIEHARDFLAYNFSGFISMIGTGIFIFLKTGSYIAIASLILHLILRAFWIGVLGLTSVLPKGIDHERLRYSPFFKKKLEKKLTDPKNWAQKLDNVSSSIYGLTFFVFFLIIGLVIYIIIWFTLLKAVAFFTNKGPIPTYWGWLLHKVIFFGYPAMGLLSLIDFITLGGLKKGRVLSRIYYVPYRIMSILTLSFLIRPFYYLLISHVSRLRGIVYACSLVLLIFLISNHTFITNPYFPQDRQFSGVFIHGAQGSNIYKNPASYKNLKNSRSAGSAMIDRDIVPKDVSYLRLYLDLYGGMFHEVARFCEEKGHNFPLERGWKRKFFVSGKDGNFNPEGLHLNFDDFKGSWKCLNDRYKILVNDSLRNVDLFFTEYPERGDQKLVAHVPIRNLDPGRHNITVKELNVERNEGGEEEIREDLFARIPFWKE